MKGKKKAQPRKVVNYFSGGVWHTATKKPKKRGRPRKKRPVKLFTVDKPKSKTYDGPGWPPWVIAGILKAKQINGPVISYELGVKNKDLENTVRRIFDSNYRICLRIRLRICAIVGEDYEDVWGEEKPYYFARFL